MFGQQHVKMWLVHNVSPVWWKRRTFKQKWTFVVWIVIAIVMLFVFLRHVYTEHRCASEVIDIENSAIAFTDSKAGAYM